MHSVQGIAVTDDLRSLSQALKAFQGIHVEFRDPPSQREITTDILTRNLVILAEFMEGTYAFSLTLPQN